MLFGNPWLGGRGPYAKQIGQAAPAPAPAPAQPAAPAPMTSIPPVNWPSQTPDASYAMNLANLYAGQLQNQQVPGSIPMPQAAPMPAPVPTQGLPTGQEQGPIFGGGGVPGGRGYFGGHSAYQQALQQWRAGRPANMADMQAYRQQRPHFRDFRQGF